jgi:predicted MFS family arabinose efflux permease
MLPLELFRDRNRSGAYMAMLFTGAGLMGTFYLMSLYLQQVLLFEPLKAGLASLPFSVGIILGAGVSSKLVERHAPRMIAGPGLILGALGMFWRSTLSVGAPYAGHILPAVFLNSFGLILGLTAVVITLTAVHGVPEDWAGIASALVNTAQQVGAALGLALFTTISIAAANTRTPGAAIQGHDALASSADALAYGYATAFFAGAAMLVAAAVTVIAAVNTKRTHAAAGTMA